jgi:hypothetical protein
LSFVFLVSYYLNFLLKDYKNYEKVIIKSNGKLLLSSDIHDDNPNDNENSVITLAYSNMSGKLDQKLSVWIYLLSVLIGLALLILCTIGFWMVNFPKFSIN